MTSTGTATASIEVAVDPKTAFDVFTADIGIWWKRGTHYWVDPERGQAMRFEPHVGGRLVEVYDTATGEGHDIGLVTAWEPGSRLHFTWRMPDWPAGVSTDVEVDFEPVGDNTLVTVVHHGWDRIGDGVDRASGYGSGWSELLTFFAARAR
ncbi:hypothetical protein Val02_15350 [Virgisporangium aliadipatigenens]|uniref:Activator of Hsp90 ATPase homologue 1/2-like C-terminal domain-containing protein n=1 Tax=Virgisporangium aliadipatigenens TaxID=741659 RepID=A0A8J4DNP5_9ACTN|nr:SRPBCC domain-containing protein [Virgisporangium aliadipatigenens]GIJ44649.1 hypothetical protein Val02_15350 [Virgisporangium aliadipatigenens]